MGNEKDYVLGTHDEEIERLGLQHRVWRTCMLEAWQRAGITRDTRFIDIGAGPGYATVDAAEIVGPGGAVAAVERSEHFLGFARQQAASRGLSWIQFHRADLVEDELPCSGFDLAWCRWVASFVASPPRLVERIHSALRPGGKVVLHEYVHYGTLRAIPRSEHFERFVAEVEASWRASGGEPDIALTLLPLLKAAGLKVLELRPLVFAVRPPEFTWQWPATFIATNPQRLVELGRVTPEWARALQADFQALTRNPDAVLITPMVMEIIAERIA